MRTHYSSDITEKMDGKKVVVIGWVRIIREMGSIKFLILGDRDGRIQVTIKKGEAMESVIKKTTSLNREDIVKVEGTVKKNSKAPSGFEIMPDSIEIISKSHHVLPLDLKTKAELDTRLNARYIDLRKPEVGAIFRIRDKLLTAGREFLEKRDFIEIHTPRIIASASEGGTQLFPISYFEKEAFLAQSPQLYKQMMMATGFDRVYETATYFRAEEHNTIWHLNEITALDLEMAFIKDENDVMDTLEGLVVHIMKSLKKNAKEELDAIGKKLTIPKKAPRITYDEALKMLEKDKIKIEWGDDLNTEAEKKLGVMMKKKGFDLFFITKYPTACRAFYSMAEPGNEKISRAFDLEYKGREITSGAQRIHDYDTLVKAIKKNGLNPDNFSSYLESFRYGMPPHGGFGLGVERLLMLLLELPNIREAVLFPRDRKRMTP